MNIEYGKLLFMNYFLVDNNGINIPRVNFFSIDDNDCKKRWRIFKNLFEDNF